MESSSKDKRQKQARQLAAFNAILDETVDVQEQKKPTIWDFTERRSGEDRRQSFTDRGRWLESRAKQDRRKSPSLCMQI